MYVTVMRLNPDSQTAQRDLRDPQALHKTVMSGFPPVLDPERQARAYWGVLHRLEYERRTGRVLLYVQSRVAPDWSILPDDYLVNDGCPNPAAKPVEEAYRGLAAGRTLRFRLRANPTRKIRYEVRPQRRTAQWAPGPPGGAGRSGEVAGRQSQGSRLRAAPNNHCRNRRRRTDPKPQYRQDFPRCSVRGTPGCEGPGTVSGRTGERHRPRQSIWDGATLRWTRLADTDPILNPCFTWGDPGAMRVSLVSSPRTWG